MKSPIPSRKKKNPPRPHFPKGWDQKRVQAVIDYYDNQTEDEELAEYLTGIALEEGKSMMVVPTKLVPEIRKLIARRE